MDCARFRKNYFLAVKQLLLKLLHLYQLNTQLKRSESTALPISRRDDSVTKLRHSNAKEVPLAPVVFQNKALVA
jgi:hypothetical protein